MLVVAHDAGAAEIIAAYVRGARARTQFVCYAAGPAARIFRREHIPYGRIADNGRRIAQIFRHNKTIRELLIGTGWMTKIETRALSEAKRRGLHTAVYLDSWKNYRERFGFPAADWKTRLPDEIWAGDTTAFRLAKRQFPSTVSVGFVKNRYFANIKRTYAALQHKRSNTILYVSTPEKASVALLSALVRRTPKMNIRVRLHPVDKKDRYKKFLNSPRITFSREDLVHDLASVRAAVGRETTALAIAGMLGVTSVTVMPANAPVVLPFSKMTRVGSAAEAAKKLARIRLS